jgi:outer membrane lipoprotein-sorting protein
LASVTVPTPTLVQGADGGLSIPAAVKLVQNYFNTLGTWQADFVQEQTGEATQRGVFKLNRPARQFVWQYEKPLRQKVISTGTATYYEGNGQTTQLPNNSGLARFFTAKKLNLNDERIRVVATRQTPFMRVVGLALDSRTIGLDQAALKSVELTFSTTSPAVLQQVVAVDALGGTTTLAFSNQTTGLVFPRGTCVFENLPGRSK